MPGDADSEKKDSKRKIFRLVDMVVNEVSIVDRAANKHEWVLVKQENGDMAGLGDDVFGGDNGNDDEALFDGDQLFGLEKAVQLPPPVKAAASKALKGAGERLAKLIDSVKGASTTDEKLPSPIPGPVASEIRAISTVLKGLLSKYPSPAMKSGDTTDEEIRAAVTQKFDVAKALTIPGAVKSRVLLVLGQVSNRLASVAAKVDGAGAGGGGPTPMPKEITGEINALAEMLDGLLKRYPSPAAKADDDKAGKADDDSKKKDGDDGDKAAKADGDKADDDDDDDTDKKKKSEKRGGPQMSTARRKTFKDALTKLIELAREIFPETEKLDLFPPRPSDTKKRDDADGGTDDDRDALQKQLDDEKAETARLKKALADERKRTAPSNVKKADGLDDDDDASGGTFWGTDLAEDQEEDWDDDD